MTLANTSNTSNAADYGIAFLRASLGIMWVGHALLKLFYGWQVTARSA